MQVTNLNLLRLRSPWT